MRTDADSARSHELSPEDRLHAVARLLAIALLRRRRNRVIFAPEPACKILSDSGRNDLEAVAEIPLTVPRS